MRGSILGLLLAMLSAGPAAATTYYFTGTLVSGNAATQSSIAGQTAIPNGTPFSGHLTIDTSITAPSGGGDSQHRNFPFDTGTPPAEFTFQVGSGLYSVVVDSVGNEVDDGYNANFGVGAHDAIWFWSNGGHSVGGSGQAANPLFFDYENSILLWISTPGGPLSTANVFDANQLLATGAWEFAGLSLGVLQGGSNFEQYRGAFTTFEVPEPRRAALGLGALIAMSIVGLARAER